MSLRSSEYYRTPPALAEIVDACIASARDAARVVITGCPRSGKTTLAEALGRDVRHTDDTVSAFPSRGEQLEEIASWFNAPAPWLIEGCSAISGIALWMSRQPGPPCDALLYLDTPLASLTRGQKWMRRVCGAAFLESATELGRRGVMVWVDRSGKNPGVAGPSAMTYVPARAPNSQNKDFVRGGSINWSINSELTVSHRE